MCSALGFLAPTTNSSRRQDHQSPFPPLLQAKPPLPLLLASSPPRLQVLEEEETVLAVHPAAFKPLHSGQEGPRRHLLSEYPAHPLLHPHLLQLGVSPPQPLNLEQRLPLLAAVALHLGLLNKHLPRAGLLDRHRRGLRRQLQAPTASRLDWAVLVLLFSKAGLVPLAMLLLR